MAAKKISTIFLQAVIVLIGAGVFAFLLWFPPHEGRNVNATLFETYFSDPFLAYVYIASIPFFVALYQVIMVLGFIQKNKAFSPATAKSLRTIKYCAFFTAGAILAANAYLFIFIGMKGKDDPAGAIMLGLIAAFASIVAGTAAGMFEQILKSSKN